MKLIKYRDSSGAASVGRLDDDRVLPLTLDSGQYNSLFDILEADNPQEVADFLTTPHGAIALDKVSLLPPIDEQEVWAAGVTYRRSQAARMEESESSASCYDKVYTAPRPEIFFKATPHRVVGNGQALRIRKDSQWNVPEPELALVLNSRLQLVGYTIGNDMSSRDIEGENPLYLPQAKVYDNCCGLGPCITLTPSMPRHDEIGIRLRIRRQTATVFEGQTSISQMARSFDELIGWLGRDNSFPCGAFLLTGTGVVPDSTFTLKPGDVVDIAVDGIGVLSNPIVQG
ncbi:MAG TPA: fumarylacetoacetate hydrolase family protein [Pirellulaceae bacterium]|nr:fumarylacetoacetate hydrolase family protein [Pirellulaceae bacterium]